MDSLVNLEETHTDHVHCLGREVAAHPLVHFLKVLAILLHNNIGVQLCFIGLIFLLFFDDDRPSHLNPWNTGVAYILDRLVEGLYVPHGLKFFCQHFGVIGKLHDKLQRGLVEVQAFVDLAELALVHLLPHHETATYYLAFEVPLYVFLGRLTCICRGIVLYIVG